MAIHASESENQKEKLMPMKRVSDRSLSVLLATAWLILVPTYAHAETMVFNCVKPPNGNVLPMRVTVDSTANKVTYQVMEADGIKPWSKAGVVAASINADSISWNANASTDVETRKYSLDRKSNKAVATDIENGGTKRIVWNQWVCNRSK